MHAREAAETPPEVVRSDLHADGHTLLDVAALIAKRYLCPMQLGAILDHLRTLRDGYDEPLYTVDPPLPSGIAEAWGDVPAGLVEFAAITSSVRGNGLDLALEERLSAYELDLLGRVIAIGHNGCGDYWLMDTAGRIWWHAHDPSVLTLAGRDITDLVQRSGQWDESNPYNHPSIPAVVEIELSTGDEASILIEELSPGEGFDFETHSVHRSGERLVVTRSDRSCE